MKTRQIKNVSNDRTVFITSFASPQDFMNFVTPLPEPELGEEGSEEQQAAWKAENENKAAALEKALTAIESHFKYHVTNSAIKQDITKAKEATKDKPYVPVKIPLDLPEWLLSKSKSGGDSPTEGDKKAAAAAFAKTAEKLKAIEENDELDDTEKHTQKCELLNRFAARLNSVQHSLAQLPTMDEPFFDDDGEPNEHPLDLKSVEVALRLDRVERAKDKAKIAEEE